MSSSPLLKHGYALNDVVKACTKARAIHFPIGDFATVNVAAEHKNTQFRFSIPSEQLLVYQTRLQLENLYSADYRHRWRQPEHDPPAQAEHTCNNITPGQRSQASRTTQSFTSDLTNH